MRGRTHAAPSTPRWPAGGYQPRRRGWCHGLGEVVSHRVADEVSDAGGDGAVGGGGGEGDVHEPEQDEEEGEAVLGGGGAAQLGTLHLG